MVSGAGEALRFKFSDRFFVFVSGSYEEPSIFVLDVLLDVLLDAFIGSGTKGLNVLQLRRGSLGSFCVEASAFAQMNEARARDS